jgi:hypothetical protein
MNGGTNHTQFAAAPREIETLAKIRGLLGYVDNGSHTPISMWQDDATKAFHVRIGRPSDPWTKVYAALSLKGAIDEAYKAQGEAPNDQG